MAEVIWSQHVHFSSNFFSWQMITRTVVNELMFNSSVCMWESITRCVHVYFWSVLLISYPSRHSCIYNVMVSLFLRQDQNSACLPETMEKSLCSRMYQPQVRPAKEQSVISLGKSSSHFGLQLGKVLLPVHLCLVCLSWLCWAVAERPLQHLEPCSYLARALIASSLKVT